MAYYRVEIKGQIIGDELTFANNIYTYYGIQAVETLDRDFKPNIIYRDTEGFIYRMYLDQPTPEEIIDAKNQVRQKMKFDLSLAINDLVKISEKLSVPFTKQ